MAESYFQLMYTVQIIDSVEKVKFPNTTIFNIILTTITKAELSSTTMEDFIADDKHNVNIVIVIVANNPPKMVINSKPPILKSDDANKSIN